LIREKKDNELQKPCDIIITNKCRGNKNVFFIFEKFHELVKLQSMIDIEWNLETITTIRKNFEKEKFKMMKNSYGSYELFFFQKIGIESWDKFIFNINKENPFSYIILMKFGLFL
jgi:hypothetical protein